MRIPLGQIQRINISTHLSALKPTLALDVSNLYREKSRHFVISSRQFNMASKRISNPVLFICDIQDKFRSAIYEFPKVIATAEKMIKASKLLNIPIYATTQSASKLGPTVTELKDLMPESAQEFDKTAFSMMIPELVSSLSKHSYDNSAKVPGPSPNVIIVGIETHICVTQTTLDLLSQGYKVYVLADGVSSCNANERPVALQRLAREGAIVTTSESLLFELMGDANGPNFKAISSLVKETKENTKSAVETFCKL